MTVHRMTFDERSFQCLWYTTINITNGLSKSKSDSSEFVFNPDPNFLAKINANIRQNNEIVCGDPEPPEHHDVHLEEEEEEEEEEFLA